MVVIQEVDERLAGDRARQLRQSVDRRATGKRRASSAAHSSFQRDEPTWFRSAVVVSEGQVATVGGLGSEVARPGRSHPMLTEIANAARHALSGRGGLLPRCRRVCVIHDHDLVGVRRIVESPECAQTARQMLRTLKCRDDDRERWCHRHVAGGSYPIKFNRTMAS